MAVLSDEVLGPDELSTACAIELQRVGTRLLAVADAEPIGPGTPRMNVAGAVVYVADLLTDGKTVTHAQVVAAVERVVITSRNKFPRYSQAVADAAVARAQPGNAVDELATADRGDDPSVLRPSLRSRRPTLRSVLSPLRTQPRTCVVLNEDFPAIPTEISRGLLR